ncbi:hypothetical protein [Virgibacillus salexigens]|uniref:hypothetical protein n=1 Tax=Virgibacillus massiliensis TaxID=1462526 RepID=UPI00136C1E6D|nr:hypothetical protein [Virgibacillus massiliensis]MYL43988.1 hypothetical protein [Virgibacillus massiliensis]
MSFFDQQALNLLEGLIEKHGRQYAEKELHVTGENTQEAVLATAKKMLLEIKSK